MHPAICICAMNLGEVRQGAKPAPSLLFMADFAEIARTATPADLDCIASLSITNVVLLATMKLPPALAARRGKWRRAVTPPKIATSDAMASVSHEAPKKHAAHYRIATIGCRAGRRDDGKFLLFGTNQMIRAGKHCHADAGASAVRAVRAMRAVRALAPTAMPATLSCPNTVVTGKCTFAVSRHKLQQHWRAHFTPRFPGIAIDVPGSAIVPEFYLSDNRFILPGVRDAQQLFQAAVELGSVLLACQETAPTEPTTPTATAATPSRSKTMPSAPVHQVANSTPGLTAPGTPITGAA